MTTTDTYYANGKEVQLFEQAFRKHLPVMLTGPTGCGKTRLVEHMGALLGRPVVTISCHDDLTSSDLVGRFMVTGGDVTWADGPLTRAVKAGAICYLDEVTAAEVGVATAVEDIAHDEGAIPQGTVAAQRHEWTAWVGGQPLIIFHAIYVTAGPDKLEPAWDWGETRYEIVIEGDPPTELTLKGVRQPDGTMAHPGYDWTAMGAINAIPDVCDAAPGWVNHLDLGLIRPRRLVRP